MFFLECYQKFNEKYFNVDFKKNEVKLKKFNELVKLNIMIFFFSEQEKGKIRYCDACWFINILYFLFHYISYIFQFNISF